MDKKTSNYLNCIMAFFFTAVFTLVGGLVNGFDWKAVPMQFIVGLALGLIVGFIIPAGDVGGAIAAKICQPGTRGFSFIMFNVILVIMLIFMCPLMTVAFASVLGGVPVAAVLPSAYDLFVPFYVVGSLLLMLVGEPAVKLAEKLAHPKD